MQRIELQLIVRRERVRSPSRRIAVFVCGTCVVFDNKKVTFCLDLIVVTSDLPISVCLGVVSWKASSMSFVFSGRRTSAGQHKKPPLISYSRFYQIHHVFIIFHGQLSGDSRVPDILSYYSGRDRIKPVTHTCLRAYLLCRRAVAPIHRQTPPSIHT